MGLSHQRIFIDSRNRDDEAYAREVIGAFMQRAFRRPVAKHEVARYHEFWRVLRPDFATFEEAVGEVLVAVLCSPNFLYMVEPDAALAATRGDDLLDEHSLANRLSYFLWHGPPDAELWPWPTRGACASSCSIRPTGCSTIRAARDSCAPSPKSGCGWIVRRS